MTTVAIDAADAIINNTTVTTVGTVRNVYINISMATVYISGACLYVNWM